MNQEAFNRANILFRLIPYLHKKHHVAVSNKRIICLWEHSYDIHLDTYGTDALNFRIFFSFNATIIQICHHTIFDLAILSQYWVTTTGSEISWYQKNSFATCHDVSTVSRVADIDLSPPNKDTACILTMLTGEYDVSVINTERTFRYVLASKSRSVSNFSGENLATGG